MRQGLPPELAEHIWAAAVDGTTLTVLVASGAWASRVRYSAPQLAPGVALQLKRPINRIAVRVRPPGQSRRAGRSRETPRGG